MRTCPGRKPTDASRRYSSKTESAQPPIILEVSDLKINHTQLIKTPKVEEVEITKTADQISSVEEVAKEGVTEHPKAEVITTKEDIANLEVRNNTLMTQSRLTITDRPNFMIANIPQTRGTNLNKKTSSNFWQDQNYFNRN